MARLAECLAETPADAILDAPPGTSCPAGAAVAQADGIVLVTEPTPFGVHDFRLAVESFAPLGKPMAGGTLQILTDNRAADADLDFEHGWSVLVDLGPGRRWLWDTGQTDLFRKNAAAMRLFPEHADGVALSHGHYDHAGGLPALLAAGYTGPIVAHPDLLSIRYSRRDGATSRSIGMLRICSFNSPVAMTVW